jgi:pimeloyl-ACP methyl ester carboxylesterase/quinol monooxygenase YgiN
MPFPGEWTAAASGVLRRRDFVALAGTLAVAPLVLGAGTLTRHGGGAMYGLIGRINAVPGRRDELAAILLEGTSEMAGCLAYIVAKDLADADALWITEVWDSRESHGASLRLPVVQQAVAQARPIIAGFGERIETEPVGRAGHVGVTPAAAATAAAAHADGPHRVSSTDGTPIAVWRSGSGPPLLLVHGTTADHTRWARVAPLFAARFTVYAMDRRGRGQSGDAPAYSIEREGADIAAVAGWIGEPVSLVGHSYGAICSIEAALRIASLHRLVLYEPPLPMGIEIVAPAASARLQALVDADEREEALLVFFREVVQVPEPQLAIMRKQPAWPARVAAAHTITREMHVERDYALDMARLRTVTTPTLLLLGGESQALFREATERLDRALPHSRIHEMPGQQHVAMDVIPDEFVRIVSEFLLA